MALSLREGAAKKADIQTDYAFEVLNGEAADQISNQIRADLRLMSRVVLVTLEKPYKDDPEATVVLAWGREEATPIGGEGAAQVAVPSRSLLGDQDPSFRAPRWVPGRWVHYHLRYNEGPLGKCICGMDPSTTIGPTVYMPLPVAKAWFGDWDVVSYELQHVEGQVIDQVYTRSWHRDRVANEMWGGYGYDFPLNSPGVKRTELKKFDPPAVPHVMVQRIDSMNRRIPNTEARPWDIFRWQDQVETGPRKYHTGNAPQEEGVIGVTESQLDALVERLVNARLAQMMVDKRKGAQ